MADETDAAATLTGVRSATDPPNGPAERLDDAFDFLTVPEVARDAGVTLTTVHNWLKYHRYMEWRRLLGRPVVHREEYARFKREHADIVAAKRALPVVPG